MTYFNPGSRPCVRDRVGYRVGDFEEQASEPTD